MKTLMFLLRAIVTTNTEKPKLDISAINILIAKNIEEIYNKLNIEYVSHQNRVSISCPYHSGNKNTSFNLFRDYGNVVCWTRHCEVNHGKWGLNLLSFLLKMNINDTIKWLESFLKVSTDCLVVNSSNYSFNNIVRLLCKTNKQNSIIDRSYVKNSLKIPSIRFLNRGFSEKVLIEHDVGFCDKVGTEMYLRDTVPVYNEDNCLIGALGRTIYKKCIICEKFHPQNRMCPAIDSVGNRLSSKWINSKGFSTGNYLYNWNMAKKIANDSGTLIITEGCGDCFRLIDAGFENCVSLFGCRMTDEQKILIESSKIKNLILCLDNDEAGKNGTESIAKELSRYYNIKIVVPELHDFGDMTINDIKKQMRGVI